MTRKLTWAAAVALILLTEQRVAAHGIPPEISQVVSPAAAETVVVTTRGLLFGDPKAHRWSLVCSDAFGASVGIGYRVALAPSGRLLIAGLTGLKLSDDRGCTFEPHAQLGQADVTYLFQDAARPERLYATVFGERGGVHGSDDAGETFRPLYQAAGDEFLNSVMGAPGNRTQVYATLSTTEEVARLFVLRSSDDGTTWERTELHLLDEPIDVTLLAVNPANASEMLLRVRYLSQLHQDVLLQSRDAGRTFIERERFPRIADAAFSADGTASFVVTSGALLRAGASDTTYVRVEVEDNLTYGAVIDGRMLVGGYRATNGRLGVNMWSTPVGVPSGLEPWMSFGEVTSLQTCAMPSKLEAKCAVDWLDWSQEFLGEGSLLDR